MRDADLELRPTIESLFRTKIKLLDDIRRLEALDVSISKTFEEVDGHSPFRLEFQPAIWGERREEKHIDQVLWRYLAALFHLEKYMLCTDYEKMRKEIEEFRAPVFTIEHAQGWIDGLKGLIQDNVNTLIKKVFEGITQGTYCVGSGYGAEEKKRNNNGVDKSFILRTYDYSSGYYRTRPTITDDIEKVCYLLAGKTVPEITAKTTMHHEHTYYFENEYFSIKICKNGNTHYTICDDIRGKLNLYGPEGSIIGENIKIKILDKNWRAKMAS